MPVFETEDGCSIYYRVYGDEVNTRSIVFLNGTAQTTRNWMPFGSKLKRRFRVVLYDTRGQGESGRGVAPMALNTHVADLESLLDHLEMEKAGLVGLSHGGRVALAAASRMPGRIDRLLLCSVGLTSGPRISAIIQGWCKILEIGGLSALAWAMVPLVFGERFLKDHRAVLSSVVDALVQRNDRDRLSELLAAQADYPPVGEYAGRAVFPVLVIAGAEDPLVTADGPRQLAEMMGAGFQRLSEVGHSIPAEAPDRFLELLYDFFRE